MIYKKFEEVYFRGNPTKKEWYKGRIQCLFHTSGVQFEQINTEDATYAAGTWALIGPIELSVDGLPFAPSYHGTFNPQLIPLDRVQNEPKVIRPRKSDK